MSAGRGARTRYATLITPPRNAVAEMSAEDGEIEEMDEDLDDDGWESESEDDF